MNAFPLTLVRLTPDSPELPLLIVGPSLGTASEALWGRCADLLAADFEVIGWELPGHGHAKPPSRSFRVEDLAAGVIATVDEYLPERSGRPFYYAGDSIGGAVGLVLLAHHGRRIAAATLACTGARIGSPEMWKERANLVRSKGTSAVLKESAKRWFGSEFLAREPTGGNRLLDVLQRVDAEGYAMACEALAAFDARAELHAIHSPLTLVAGSEDEATPTAGLEDIARRVMGSRLVVLDGVAHLAPIEAPEAVTEAIYAAAAGRRSMAQVSRDGMAVRREVLGDAWVDRAMTNSTALTQDFQQFITQYAWGTVWTRPGLDRRSRSMITITALVAQGHQEELALHIRAALNNGVTRDEIKEVLIHSAIYCGVPAANSAFRIAQKVLDESDVVSPNRVGDRKR